MHGMHATMQHLAITAPRRAGPWLSSPAFLTRTRDHSHVGPSSYSDPCVVCLVQSLAASWCHYGTASFLEALVRVSTLKALPTDYEVAEAGHEDAATYLTALMATDEAAYAQLVRERAVEWGAAPRQPADRCVAHVIAMVLREIEEETAGRDDLRVTEKEARLWVAERLGRMSTKQKR